MKPEVKDKVYELAELWVDAQRLQAEAKRLYPDNSLYAAHINAAEKKFKAYLESLTE